MKLKTALEKIDQLAKSSLSAEQKLLAKNMLKKAPEEAVSEWYNFIIQRIKIGFTFDAAPAFTLGNIALIKENKSLSINLNDCVACLPHTHTHTHSP